MLLQPAVKKSVHQSTCRSELELVSFAIILPNHERNFLMRFEIAYVQNRVSSKELSGSDCTV